MALAKLPSSYTFRVRGGGVDGGLCGIEGTETQRRVLAAWPRGVGLADCPDAGPGGGGGRPLSGKVWCGVRSSGLLGDLIWSLLKIRKNPEPLAPGTRSLAARWCVWAAPVVCFLGCVFRRRPQGRTRAVALWGPRGAWSRGRAEKGSCAGHGTPVVAQPSCLWTDSWAGVVSQVEGVPSAACEGHVHPVTVVSLYALFGRLRYFGEAELMAPASSFSWLSSCVLLAEV